MYLTDAGLYPKEFDQLHKILVQDKNFQPDSLQGQIINAIDYVIHCLHTGNYGSERVTALNEHIAEFYDALVNPANSGLEEFAFPLDEATVEQAKQDIGVIQIWVYHCGFLTDEQMEKVWQVACPSGDVAEAYAACDRVTDRVVEWCKANPILVSPIPELKEMEGASIAEVFTE